MYEAFAAALQLFAQFFWVCYCATELGSLGPRDRTNIQEKDGKGNRGGGKKYNKCRAHFPCSSPCWNPPSFHLAVAAAMNYAWGVFELCQEPTPTLLRCRGRLIVTLPSEVLDYKEERCPCTTFHFFLPLSLPPFCPSLRSSVISVTSQPPRSPPNSNSALSAVP